LRERSGIFDGPDQILAMCETLVLSSDWYSILVVVG